MAASCRQKGFIETNVNCCSSPCVPASDSANPLLCRRGRTHSHFVMKTGDESIRKSNYDLSNNPKNAQAEKKVDLQ